MKIVVAKTRKLSSRSYNEGDDLSAVFHIVTVTKYKLAFTVEMGDGRTYESSAVVHSCTDDDESTWVDSPVNDIPKFSKDIEGVAFPDLIFYDEYDEFHEAEEKNDENAVAVWLMYPEDRQKGEQEAVDNLIEQVIAAWIADYFGNSDKGVDAYIRDLVKGYASLC